MNHKEIFNLDENEPKCRICLSNDKGHLISPCRCKGSIGMVHRACLEHWLETQNVETCELCKMPFKVIRTPKGFCEWLVSDNNLEDRKYLLKDICILTFLTPMATVSTILCIKEIISYFKTTSNFFSAMSLIFVTFVLMFTYLLFMVVTLRYHYKKYVWWRRINYNVHLASNLRRNEESIEEDNISVAPNQSSNLTDANRTA